MGRIRGLFALGAVALWACATPTSMLFVVESDLSPGDEVTALEVRIRRGGEEVHLSRHTVDEARGFPQSLRVLAGSGASTSHEIAVTALRGEERVHGAARTFRFIDGEEVVERICIERACIGLGTSACLQGRCEGGPADGDADVDVDADSDADGDGDAAADGEAGPDGDEDGPTDGAPDGAPCDGVVVECVGDALRECVDGELREEACPLGCDETLGRCRLLAPANVAAGLLGRGTADVTIGAGAVIDTELCEAEAMALPEEAVSVEAMAGGGEACVVTVSSLRVDPGAMVVVSGSRPLVVLAAASVAIDGAVDCGAHGSIPGPAGGFGGVAEVDAPGMAGGGAGSGVAGAIGDYSSGGGGGGGSGRGGRGGDVLYPTATVRGGDGGGRGAGATVEPLVGGGGGGGGANETVEPTGTGGTGGAGGGACQISAGEWITVGPTGVLVAGGGGGGAGELRASAGGGGAGGALLLEAPVVTVDGVLAANGGGGGASDAGSPGEDGGASSERAAGGTTSRSGGGDGGAGGAGDRLDGDAAEVAGLNAGGGGGGAGRVRLDTRSRAATITGTVSPSDGDGFSEGTVRTY